MDWEPDSPASPNGMGKHNWRIAALQMAQLYAMKSFILLPKVWTGSGSILAMNRGHRIAV